MKIQNQKPKARTKKQNFVFDFIKSPQKKGNHLLNIIIFFLLLSLFIIIYFFITWIINYDKTATLEYYLAPSTATITLDQQNLQPEGKIKLKPGTYKLKITKQGFTDFSTEIELKPNQTTPLYKALEPDSTNSDYYQTHPDEASRVQHIADANADLERKNYTDSDPIFKITPYSSYQNGFSIISEKQENTSKILLKIDLLTCSDDQIQKLKDAAYQYLKDNKINPDNYDIRLTNC